MNPEAAAASGADSFGANGSNAGKKAVHVKVCFVVQSFCLCLNNDEIEIHGGHHKCFGICHDLLVMRPSTSTKNQTQRSYRYFRERYFNAKILLRDSSCGEKVPAILSSRRFLRTFYLQQNRMSSILC